MKESRFIELLNLYVDHQLSAAEAPELEAEIARNATRRTTYQQYCRMQKACTLLFEQERSHAPASIKLAASLRDANRKIIAFPESRSRGPRGYFPVGLLAAAACVAFVFVRFNAPENSGAPQQPRGIPVALQQSVEPAQAVAIPVEVAPPVPTTNTPASFYSVFVTRRAAQESLDTANARFTSNNSVTPTVSYAWMQQVELEPVQSLSQGRLTLQSSSVSSEDRVLSSRKPVQGPWESSAFTFQR